MRDLSRYKTNNAEFGFTLVEVVVATAILLMVALGMYQAFAVTMKVVSTTEVKNSAVALANEQMEIVRNLAYENVGIQGGLPSGSIPHIQNIVRNGFLFTVTAIVRNIDDPFDGQIGSSTKNDLSPADYRLVEFTIECDECNEFTPMSFTSYVGPRGLETSSTNGALFIHVFDAEGQPVQGADVHIVNTHTTSTITIDDTTNNTGYLQIVDTPPGINSYEISVTKPGYSSEQTYPLGDLINPNPAKPHMSVLTQQLSQVSFSIDKTSQLDFSSMTTTCTPVGNIDFSLSGSKLIGTSPDIKKFSGSYTTNGSGMRTISDVEWDTYTLNFTDGTYDLAGTIPTLPLIVNPDSHQNVSLIVTPKDPRALLVTVVDSGTKLPISGASVSLEKSGETDTLFTGRGFMSQTDWSGGSGQDAIGDTTRYFWDDGSIEKDTPSGQLQLANVFGSYLANGTLISSTFDTGTSSNFQQILWQPQTQPPAVGSSSVRIQLATNLDNATWDFKGPDGTASTYYTLSDQDVSTAHNGDRYLRYKLFLQTSSSTWTPIVSDVSFTFTSSCTPPGQVVFTDMDSGIYTVTVTKPGYQDYVTSVSLGSNWQQLDISLTP